MKKLRESQLLKSFYDIRALLYTLLIGIQLMFLLSLKDVGLSGDIYFLIVSSLFLVSASEFIFSMYYTGRKYHKDHPLRDLYRRLRKHHLYNIMLLPVVQYISCVIIIYLNQNTAIGVDVTYLTIINISAILITMLMTYFTFFAYRKIYNDNLNVDSYVEDFFDVSKYVSFAFLCYIIFVIQRMAGEPRLFSSFAIGAVQLVYLMSALWRRSKLNLFTFIIATGLCIVTSGIVYLFLLLFNDFTIAIVTALTAQALIIDYVMTSIFIRWVQKNLTYLMIAEYILVAMISIMLLYLSRS